MQSHVTAFLKHTMLIFSCGIGEEMVGNAARAAGVLGWSKHYTDREHCSPVGQIYSPLLAVHMQSVQASATKSLSSNILWDKCLCTQAQADSDEL